MSIFYEKVDVNVELPSESWRGFVLTDASGVQFKRIATYLKDENLWLDGQMYREEFVTHWLREDENYERLIKLENLQRKISNV
jgi:hypothetical protein